MEWTEHAIGRLRRLWDVEKLPTGEIGRQLGCSKNAVIGKARRIGCDNRENPTVAKAREPKPPRKPSWIVKRNRANRVRLAPKPIVVREVKLTIGKLTCCWPLGEPGSRSFRFCDEPALLGKSYCDVHFALAYVRRPVAQAA